MFDLFKPNIPHLRSGLISNKCFINKRILLEKSRESNHYQHGLCPRRTSLTQKHCVNPRWATTSLTSREPHMNDSDLYWMLMTMLKHSPTAAGRQQPTKNKPHNPLSRNWRSKPGSGWTHPKDQSNGSQHITTYLTVAWAADTHCDPS